MLDIKRLLNNCGECSVAENVARCPELYVLSFQIDTVCVDVGSSLWEHTPHHGLERSRARTTSGFRLV